MDGYPPPPYPPQGSPPSGTREGFPFPTGWPYPYNPVDESNNPYHDHKNFWEKLAFGAKAGVIFAAVLSLVLIIVLSVWYCCGCCGLRRAYARRNELQNPTPGTDTVPLQDHQLTTIPTMTTISSIPPVTLPLREAPPPLYTETTPPQHTFIAGGITHVRDEEEGIISDGKTPLSEIPFEDVVLDHTPSSSSSARYFGQAHLGLGGDTTGHTNS